jgi:PPP family 3-phenylpropionic acid transporter
MLKNRKKIIIPSLFYAFFYMTMGSYISYIGLYYESLNLDNVQIGLISSVGILFGMLAQPLWGTISDRSKNKTFILRAMLIVSACIIWLIPLSGRVFIYVMISTALFRFFFNSIPPVGDSIALEIAKKEKFKFSTVRMLGSVGFAIAAAETGKIYATNIAYIFMIFFVLIISTGFISFFLPPVVGRIVVCIKMVFIFFLVKFSYYIFCFCLAWADIHACISVACGICKQECK